ncbi:alpha/beta fold hydrolase [Muricoccus radiodurans]|uniref:alpha/beta fold hydrolase n=1 Tax=Muricoccus radiodurans TaxID=2231721 RepID=UPI003CEB6994
MRTRMITAGGIATRIAEAGSGPAIVLIPPGLFGHGTLGGLFCPTLNLWDTALPALAATNRVVALDTLGQGSTGAGTVPPTLDAALGHLTAVLDALGISRAHLVGHDEGAMLAVRLAFQDPGRVASCTLVSAPTVAPTGDGLNPLFLANPLEPRLSEQGQRWALERLSWSPHHINPALLADAVAAPPPAEAPALMGTAMKAKGENFAAWRDTGFPVPAMVVWGQDDPAFGPAYGRSLFELIAARQPATQLHLLNRAGYFPYREQPRLFNGLVAGFVQAVEE